MLKNIIIQQLIRNLDFEPTKSQSDLIVNLADFIAEGEKKEIFVIKGYAGTGKTTLVNSIVKTLHSHGKKTVLLAPTGRAAKVLAGYTGHPAFTIHKKIYRQKSGRDGLGEFVLDFNLHKETWFIIDEASMVGDRNPENNIFGSGDLLADLEIYVGSGRDCRLIMLGDTAQLPPVGLELSPALDKPYLQRMGFLVNENILIDVIRQAFDSGILANATLIREKISEGGKEFSYIKFKNFKDVIRVSGNEVLEEIDNCYSKYGIENTIVVSRSNKRANKFNEGIRRQILWREEEISTGDILMIVKNNYYWQDSEKKLDFIANGDIARIERIKKYEDIYGYRFAHVVLNLIDYDIEIETIIMLNTLNIETASLPLDEQREFFNRVMEDFDTEKTRKQKVIKTRENPYFNALQVKFSYAVTCHKAQGGQWKAVFIDIGYFKEEMLSSDYLRWLYTAFTRASEKLYLVNFPEGFFE
jgi:exodeoxyribonuclease V